MTRADDAVALPRIPIGPWVQDAACGKANPDHFEISAGTSDLRRAATLCAGCPVRRRCGADADANGDRGLWGGILRYGEGRRLDLVAKLPDTNWWIKWQGTKGAPPSAETEPTPPVLTVVDPDATSADYPPELRQSWADWEISQARSRYHHHGVRDALTVAMASEYQRRYRVRKRSQAAGA